MKVVVVVGHNEENQGASNSTYNVTEFMFNQKLAQDIVHNFSKFNKKDNAVIMYRENGEDGYRNLPGRINNLSPDLVISLHCNAFNTIVNGCEVLYYHTSIDGKEIAKICQEHLVKGLGNNDRGIKSKTTEDRGGYLLRYTEAPCVICEPFFIDNDDDFSNADKYFKNGDLTTWYCEAIDESLEYLKS